MPHQHGFRDGGGALEARRRAQTTGASVLLGLVGEVREPLDQEGGQVLVNGELWRARSDLPLAAGERARVVGVEGLTVRVVREG